MGEREDRINGVPENLRKTSSGLAYTGSRAGASGQTQYYDNLGNRSPAEMLSDFKKAAHCEQILYLGQNESGDHEFLDGCKDPTGYEKRTGIHTNAVPPAPPERAPLPEAPVPSSAVTISPPPAPKVPADTQEHIMSASEPVQLEDSTYCSNRSTIMQAVDRAIDYAKGETPTICVGNKAIPKSITQPIFRR